MDGSFPPEPWRPFRGRRAAPPLLATWLAATGVAMGADEIYRSVDAQGTVVYSDHADPSLGRPSVVQLQDPRYPPRELHFCWTNCFTLVYDQGLYRRADGTDETWSVETFTSRSVVLHRHDAPAAWNGFSPDVTYAGEVIDDRLASVTVNGSPVGGIAASWGTALHDLPGSNAEREAGRFPGTDSSGNADSPGASTVTSTVAPPPLPDSTQPAGTEQGSLWTPGYWSWRDQGYFWVPGAWVRAPRAGLLWTPAYWSFTGAVYVFHPGYWGAHVGFYGGVNYGNGYTGTGYVGGRWEGNTFVYDRGVNHLQPALLQHSYDAPLAARETRRVTGYRGDPDASRAGRAPHAPSATASPTAPPRASRVPTPVTSSEVATSTKPVSATKPAVARAAATKSLATKP